jgi:hypothetical protein
MTKRLLLNAAAKELGVTPHFLRTEARAGKIPCIYAGNRYVFDIQQVEDFLKQRAMNNVKSGPSDNASYGVLHKIAT